MRQTEENFAVLKDSNGQEVLLKGVNVTGRIHGLMAEVEVEQSYANAQQKNIEAIYTFPLPLGAVLLGLDVEIAGKQMTGAVVEKKQAERQYEDAITDGETAIMLEEAGPGLYTVSIGNLLAGEFAMIKYRYALILSWQVDRMRLLIPTTIAPRYGNSDAAGLRPHQVPSASFAVDYPLTIVIKLEGEHTAAVIASPSHPISVQRTEDFVTVKLEGKAYLDRDFILSLQSETAQSSCLLVSDGNNKTALASLRIAPLREASEEPIALKIVIDCSGSMGGISIAQARKAALEILNLLRPVDRFNITLFGSSHDHFFKNVVQATSKNITYACNWLENMQANMGGTEMEHALAAAFSIDPKAEAKVLLITDGEIHEHEKLVQTAIKSGHQIFTVGVGNAVSEIFLKSLAEKTGAACELVAPQEGMSERVMAQFHRMRQPKIGDLKIVWPCMPTWQTPLPETVFAGDTIHVFAGFSQSIEGAVELSVTGNTVVSSEMVSSNELQVPRVAAARRIEGAVETEGLKLALDYQLLSRWTNFLVVAERAEKADDLPTVHQIPQMLAAGWGGAGMDMPVFCRKQTDLSAYPAVMRSNRSSSVADMSIVNLKAGDCFNDIEFFDIPDFLKKSSDGNIPTTYSPAKFIARLEREYFPILRESKMPTLISELVSVGIEIYVAEYLREWVSRGQSEMAVVAAFLYALTESKLGTSFGRFNKRTILKYWKQMSPSQEINADMQTAMSLTDKYSWNWQSNAVIT